MFHSKTITCTSRSLPPNDRRRLLDKNGDLLYQFKAAYTYSEDTVYTRTIDAISRSGEFPALEDIKQKVAGEEVRSPRLEYGQVRAPAPSLASEIFKSIFFAFLQLYSSPWAASYEDEEKHRVLTQDMRVKYAISL